AGHVGEDEVADGLVRPAQTLGESFEQVHCGLRALIEPGGEVVVLEAEQLRLGHSGDGGRTWARIEEAELTDDLAGADHGQQVLAAIGGLAADLELARGDDVELVTGIALMEEHGSPTET